MKKLTRGIIMLLLITSQVQAQQKGKSSSKNTYGGTRYVYAKTITNEPVLDSYESPSPSPGVITPSIHSYYKPQMHTYLSNIVTMTNYSEEKEYRFKDECGDNMKQKLYLNNEHATVVSVTVYAFKTYKEASVSRSVENDFSTNPK
jgi:hypothetical protein